MRTLNLGQRVVLVVALGAVCVAVDGFVAWQSSSWFGYAPNTGAVFDPDGGKTRVLVIRIVLALARGVGQHLPPPLSQAMTPGGPSSRVSTDRGAQASKRRHTKVTTGR